MANNEEKHATPQIFELGSCFFFVARSVEDFHIYVPTGLLATPTLEGLSGALWSGFSAAGNET